MRFHIDIDELDGGRPEGRLRDERTGAAAGFSGWVELLRLLEGHCLAAAGAEADPEPATDATVNRRMP